MIYIAVLILAAIGFFIWFHVTAKKQLSRNLNQAVYAVKLGLCERLLTQYKASYKEEFAGWLAAAVTNEAFSEVPSGEEGKAFRGKNRVLIETELRKLSLDKGLCHVLTQTIRAKTRIPSGKEDRTVEAALAFVKLERFGILIPGEEFPTLQSFYALASEFYKTRHKEE